MAPIKFVKKLTCR